MISAAIRNNSNRHLVLAGGLIPERILLDKNFYTVCKCKSNILPEREILNKRILNKSIPPVSLTKPSPRLKCLNILIETRHHPGLI